MRRWEAEVVQQGYNNAIFCLSLSQCPAMTPETAVCITVPLSITEYFLLAKCNQTLKWQIRKQNQMNNVHIGLL